MFFSVSSQIPLPGEDTIVTPEGLIIPHSILKKNGALR